MTNSRIFDFFWVSSAVPDHVSLSLTLWSWFVTKLSLEMFVVQEVSLSSCVWSATVVNRCSLQQKNMLMISFVSSFELQMIHPCLLVRSSRGKITRWWITRLSVSVSINLNWRSKTQYYVLCTMSFLVSFFCNSCHNKLLRFYMSMTWWLLHYVQIDKTYLHYIRLHFTSASWYDRS